jgi:hypothetical protein
MSRELLIKEDEVLTRIIEQLEKKAKLKNKKVLKIQFTIDYLKFIELPTSYKSKEVKEYVFNCFVNYLQLLHINNILHKGHYFYIFLTNIKDPENKNRLIIKIGYTTDLEERQKSIEYEYKCKLWLLGYRNINGIYDEIKFQNFLKKYHFEYYIPLEKMKKTNSSNICNETYYLHPSIMNDFCEYVKNLPNSLEIEQEKTKQIVEQEKTKQEEEKTKQIVEQEKTKQEEEKTKQIVEQEKTKQEQEKTKQLQLQLELKKLELGIRD